MGTTLIVLSTVVAALYAAAGHRFWKRFGDEGHRDWRAWVV
jgi:hypothetical protein